MPPHDLLSPDALRDALARRPDIETLRRLIERVPAAVLVTDRFGSYVAANDAACALTGYPRQELLRKALPDLTGPVDDAIADVLWRGFLERGEQTGEFTIKTAAGAEILVRYEAIANIIANFHVTFLTPV